MVLNRPRWGRLYGVELRFDTRFKVAETSCRFYVDSQFVSNSSSGHREET